MNNETIGDVLCSTIRQHQRRPALHYRTKELERSRTWLETGRLIAHAAAWLDECSHTEPTISFVTSPSAQSWVIEVAALINGWSINPIYDTADDDEIRHVVELVKPAVIVHDSTSAHRMQRLFPDVPRFTTDALFEDWEKSVDAAPTVQSELGVVLDELATIAESGEQANTAFVYCQSSGTTGPSKVIQLTREAAFRAARDAQDVIDHVHPRFFACLPTGHISHRIINVFWAIGLAAEVFFPAPDGSGDMASDLSAVRPTVFFGPPLFYASALAAARSECERSRQGRRLWRLIEQATQRCMESSTIIKGRTPLAGKIVGRRLAKAMGVADVKQFFSGTSTLAPDVHACLAQLGWFVRNTYGVSEMGGAITISGPSRMLVGEVGVPVGDVEMRIDEDGQLLVRTPTLMLGYLETERLQADAWWPTGDLMVPAESTWRHCGRIGNRIETASGMSMVGELEAIVGAQFPGTTAVLDGTDLYLFSGDVSPVDDVTLVEWLRDDELPVRRVARIAGVPSPERGEIGPTGKLRRWKVARNRSHALVSLDVVDLSQPDGETAELAVNPMGALPHGT